MREPDTNHKLHKTEVSQKYWQDQTLVERSRKKIKKHKNMTKNYTAKSTAKEKT